MRTITLTLVLALGASCGDDIEGEADTRVTDTNVSDTSVSDTSVTDTSVTDTGVTDTGFDETGVDDSVATVEVASETTSVDDAVADVVEGDAAPDDANADADTSEIVGVPLPGFGAISGDCGVLDDELVSDAPSYFVARFDFGTDAYDPSDLALLSAGAQEILADGNAGGSSIRSEMFTFELLARCELATLVKTENEVVYDNPQSKKTDMIVRIDDLLIAVNPTRAIGFPFDAPYTEAQAKTILEKKLGDINNSTLNVSAADRWVKQILVVFAYGDAHATAVQAAWSGLSADLKSDTITIVVITDGADLWIYSDQ